MGFFDFLGDVVSAANTKAEQFGMEREKDLEHFREYSDSALERAFKNRTAMTKWRQIALVKVMKERGYTLNNDDYDDD